MNASGQTETVQKLLEPLLTEDVFLVGIKIKPTNNIKVYVDADKGWASKMHEDQPGLYIKSLKKWAVLYPGRRFSLEVSARVSIDLKLLRQL